MTATEVFEKELGLLFEHIPAGKLVGGFVTTYFFIPVLPDFSFPERLFYGLMFGFLLFCINYLFLMPLKAKSDKGKWYNYMGLAEAGCICAITIYLKGGIIWYP